MDPFCFKSFDSFNKQVAPSVINRDEFVNTVNTFYLEIKDKGGLREGYAPFCKHLFIPNFTEIKSSCMKLTPENSVHL